MTIFQGYIYKYYSEYPSCWPERVAKVHDFMSPCTYILLNCDLSNVYTYAEGARTNLIELGLYWSHFKGEVMNCRSTPRKRPLKNFHKAVQEGHFRLYGSIVTTSIFPQRAYNLLHGIYFVKYFINLIHTTSIRFCGKVTYCSFNNTYIDCYNNVANICENYILGFNIYRVCSEDDVMEVFNQITCDRMVSQDCEKLNKFLNRTLCDDVYPKFDNEIILDENGNIISLNLTFSSLSNISDIDNFPLLTNLEYLELDNYNINKLPEIFFELPSLKYLNVSNNKLNSIYTEHENHLKEDRILNRKEFVDNITKYKNLNSLILNNNQFNDNIFNNLTIFENLKILFVKSNENLSGLSTKELPNLQSGIFKLYNLDVFDISYNPNLDVKFINFGKHKIYKCFVDGTPISYYQPNTCDNISEINSYAQKEIDDVLNSQLELTENDLTYKNRRCISILSFFLMRDRRNINITNKVMLTEMIYLYSKGSGENEQERCNTYTKTSHTKVYLD
ncbi:hypothetical protein U3516DRAFT_750337 [Neocallimastix sp. 'constans']